MFKSLSKQVLFLKRRQNKFKQVLKLSSQLNTDWQLSEDYNKVIHLLHLVQPLKTKLKQLDIIHKDYKNCSWWTHYLFATPSKRRAYLAKRDQITNLTLECHKDFDRLRDTLIGYIEEVCQPRLQFSFNYFSRLLPKGPLNVFYCNIFKFISSQNALQDEKIQKPQIVRQEEIQQLARNKIFSSCFDQVDTTDRLDQAYCRARFLSEFHQTVTNNKDEVEFAQNQTTAKQLHRALLNYNYSPAEYSLASLVDDNNIDLIPNFTQYLSAAHSNYAPAMAEVGGFYFRFLRAEMTVKAMQATPSSDASNALEALHEFPAEFSAPGFLEHARDMILDAYFIHDNRQAHALISDITGIAESTITSRDPTLRAITSKILEIDRAFKERLARENGDLLIKRTSRPTTDITDDVIMKKKHSKVFRLLKGAAKVFRGRVRPKKFDLSELTTTDDVMIRPKYNHRVELPCV